MQGGDESCKNMKHIRKWTLCSRNGQPRRRTIAAVFHEHDIQVPQQVQIVAFFGDTPGRDREVRCHRRSAVCISTTKTMGREAARMLG